MLELISAARRRKRPPTHQLFDVVTMEFRVGLLDIDLNMHLNNAKYLKFMDRSRLEHAVVTGLLNRMLEARCNGVVANTEIAYIRELRPYQQFQVHTRILGWDDKYVYYDQRFESQRKLHTHALLQCLRWQIGEPTDGAGNDRHEPDLPRLAGICGAVEAVAADQAAVDGKRLATWLRATSSKIADSPRYE